MIWCCTPGEWHTKPDLMYGYYRIDGMWRADSSGEVVFYAKFLWDLWRSYESSHAKHVKTEDICKSDTLRIAIFECEKHARRRLLDQTQRDNQMRESNIAAAQYPYPPYGAARPGHEYDRFN